MTRTATQERPVWRKSLIVNAPTAAHGKKGHLLDLPERFREKLTRIEALDVASWGEVEASTKSWAFAREFNDHIGAHRGRPNDMWSSTNGIGNINFWHQDAYRSAGRRNIHTDAGPNERGLNMPLTLLVDQESGARHGKLLVHNYAKPHASAAARREVIGLILDVVKTCHAAGILMQVDGDLNDDELPGAKRAGLKHVGNRDVIHSYVSEEIEVKGVRPLVKGWAGAITDHSGALVWSMLVPVLRRRVHLPAQLRVT